jgi:CTP synthase (UTP-ammonia lyase)
MTSIRIALVGDHDLRVTAHRAIPRALELAAEAAPRPLTVEWVGTETLDTGLTESITGADAIWVVPASPYRSERGAVRAITHARETGTPYLGTCAGFQHAVLEFARQVRGIAGAAHAEIEPGAEAAIVSPLTCGLVEQSGTVLLEEGSRIREIYGTGVVRETYHCNYGLNPRFEHLFSGGPLRISARDAEGSARAVELTGEAFFVATLFQPERAALEGRRHPLISAFVAAAAG